MGHQSYIYRVLIASPEDVLEERDVAEQTILRWNSGRGTDLHVTLLPVRSDREGHSEHGGHPQDFLGSQIVQSADLLVAVFWTRLGTRTRTACSGTAQEIKEVAAAGKPVLLYFSNRPVPIASLNAQQYRRLDKYKAEMKTMALIQEFGSPHEFAHKLESDLGYHVHRLEKQRLRSVPASQYTVYPDFTIPNPDDRSRTHYDGPSIPEDKYIVSLHDDGLTVQQIFQKTGWSKQLIFRAIRLSGRAPHLPERDA
ncbi:MAG: hypothetical protein PVJ57_19345 [Phycisphaerae bacterium]